MTQNPDSAPRIIALLPMKLHSERVPDKNFKDFCGKPLFRWILDTLLAVPAIDLVLINTDARERLEAKGLEESDRLKFVERPAELCGDLVSMNRIIEYDVAHHAADLYLMTHTTNPLLRRETIETALARYAEQVPASADSLFTVTKIQTRFYDKAGRPLNHDPDNLVRTQDLEPWFEENSNLYLFSRESFAATGARIGRRPAMLETAPFESTDIDTPSDWALAEALVAHYRKSGVLP